MTPQNNSLIVDTVTPEDTSKLHRKLNLFLFDPVLCFPINAKSCFIS